MGCHFLLQCVKMKSLSHVWLLATPWTAALQVPLSMGFSRQEYWNGVPLPSPPSPRVYSNSCPLSRWWHPTISSSVVPFSSCLQSFPASGSFPMSLLCIRWSKYWSFNFGISPYSEHPGLISFRMDNGWISLQSKGLSRVFSNTTIQKHQFFSAQLLL